MVLFEDQKIRSKIARVINDSGAIVGTATYSGTNTAIAAGSHGVKLVPFKLVNLADPYQGSAVMASSKFNNYSPSQ